MPVEVERVAPSPAFFAVLCRRGVVHSREGVFIKGLPVTGVAILLLLFVGAGFVAGDPGPQAAAAEPALGFVQGYVQGDVQEAHVGYYEEHLARLALEGMDCR